MKCSAHNAEATAVCPYCGKALCPSCNRSASGERTGCSEACAAALAKADAATDIIIRKSNMTAKASAFTCFFCGALFVIFGVGVYVREGQGASFLALFLSSIGIALIVCGFWYTKVARQKASRSG